MNALTHQLRGVGPERAAQLARLGIHSVGDLLLHRPSRYEDRRRFARIADLQLHEASLACGKIVAAGVKTWKEKTRSVYEFILDDGSARLHCRWWNLPYMEKYFSVGDTVVVYGKTVSIRPRTIDHPETEIIDALDGSIHLNRIAPVYPLTDGLQQRWLRALIWNVLLRFESAVAEPHPEIRVNGLPTRANAIQMLHFPKDSNDAEIARHRLALDEFIEMQLSIQTRRKNLESRARTSPCAGDNHLIRPFLAELGFTLTGAQTRVLREIRKDMAGPHPMRRLLQGDVGAGKTVVAACAVLMALESGMNAAIMAPTEILAEQHWRNFRRWFEPLGLGVELQTGSQKTASFGKDSSGDPPGQSRLEAQGRTARPACLNCGNTSPLTINKVASQSRLEAQGRTVRPACSNCDNSSSLMTNEVALPSRLEACSTMNRLEACSTLYIGTHALIEEAFAPERLGLVVIDEQHKFGVTQREELVRKGAYPHLLVMTATPIPRTLGLTLYGDLDISVIDQAPAGRGRIKTFVRQPTSLPKVWDFMRDKLRQGRQGYIVYSRVEDTGSTAGLKAVVHEFDRLREVFAPFKVGLLHGGLKGAEKEAVMAAFRANQVQLLLSTTVIEVGLDVANATLMLVENAEQFGLAQLHQLRGRIGRGAEDSFCILIAEAKTAEAKSRLKIMQETTDGFRIAEEDLRLRGPGELLGRQQSGAPPLRFGDLAQDREWIERARGLVQEYLRAKK